MPYFPTHLLGLPLQFSPYLAQEKKPQYLIAVPRLYESLHKSILSTFQAQSKVKRGIVNAATVVSAGYTQARDVAKGLVVADKQPSVVAKVNTFARFYVFFFYARVLKNDARVNTATSCISICTLSPLLPSSFFLPPVSSPPANDASVAAVEARRRSCVVRRQVYTQQRTCSFWM